MEEAKRTIWRRVLSRQNTCFGSPPKTKGIMQLFHNRKINTKKLGGTTVDQAAALLLDFGNTNAT